MALAPGKHSSLDAAGKIATRQNQSPNAHSAFCNSRNRAGRLHQRERRVMSDEINGSPDGTTPARRFFFQCPNIIFDLGLSSQELALYFVIRRTAGDDGLCWRNTRCLAQMAGMSVGSVVKAKRQLCGPFQILD